ncbi:Uncharacterised protein [Candidatus Anstonella stagnisolia]|nr:Uncharacterised protein [Candidatus Anstonella stagnisolia]
MNTKQKGQKKELIAKHEMEAQGWTCIFRTFTIKMGKFFKGIDFADIFDLVFVAEGGHWYFMSCKHFKDAGHGRTETREAIKDFIRKYKINCGMDSSGTMQFWIWIWNPARWTGRGKNKEWVKAHWEKIEVKP